MKITVSFPQTKISEACLNFAEPLLRAPAQSRTWEEVEGALKLSLLVWNAVVLDTVCGDKRFITEVRERTAQQPPIGNRPMQTALTAGRCIRGTCSKRSPLRS